MAIVETLEVRFIANLGKLGAQIATLTASLNTLGGRGTAAMAAVTGAALLAGRAMKGMDNVSAEAEKKQTRLASKLKKTGRALKGVSNAAKQAAEGIGLHKMDEVNLVGETEKKKSGSGRAGRRSGAAAKADLKGFERLKEILSQLPGFFERLYNHVRRNMSGIDGWLNKATGGLAGKMAELLGSAGKNAARSLTDKLLTTLSGARPSLASGGRSLLQSIGDALKNGAVTAAAPGQAGSTLVNKLAGGILGGQASVKTAASTVTLAAKFGGDSAKSAAESAGLNLSKGFAGGMLSYLSKIKEAAGKLASAALSKLKSLLKIASPSKLTFSMGGFFSEGFANGILASAGRASRSASVLADTAVNALNAGNMHIGGESGMAGMMRAAVNEALGATSIVIPLNVDGVKLGEASIRGINRVTRAAGRLMLEI